MTVPPKLGKLIILSGPSGAGKSTVVRKLIEVCPLPLILSVSATTRSPREGETDGKDYHFLSNEEFLEKRSTNQFLECMEVFGQGHWYGTLKNEVTTSLNAGKWVILEIDVKGAIKVMESNPDVISLFVHPGSSEELERRLRKRGTETEDAIRKRLQTAERELELSDRYQYIVVNDNVELTATKLCQILQNCGDS